MINVELGCIVHNLLGGGFKYCLFSSLLGKDFQFDENFFEMGWFNHQLACNCELVDFHGPC